MKFIKKYFIIITILLIYTQSIYSAEIIVTSPKDGFTTNQTIRIAGRIDNYNKKKAIQAQYYSSHNQPITKVNVYVVLYGGTSKEKVFRYQFTMARGGSVYHITDFQIY